MLGLKLNNVSKKGPWWLFLSCLHWTMMWWKLPVVWGTILIISSWCNPILHKLSCESHPITESFHWNEISLLIDPLKLWLFRWKIGARGGSSDWAHLWCETYLFVSQWQRVCRDHFVNAPSQWETRLHCNGISHWLGTYTKWYLGMLECNWSRISGMWWKFPGDSCLESFAISDWNSCWYSAFSLLCCR